MPDKPLPVEPGDRPSAAHHNLTDDAAFRDLSGGAPGFDFRDGFGFRDKENYPEPYAKAQSDWVENSDDPKVSVKTCDEDGTNVRGSAFDVYLHRIRATDYSDVYEDDVIRWDWDNEGRRVIISPHRENLASMILAVVNEGGGVVVGDADFDISGVTIIQPAGATEYPGGAAPTNVKNTLKFPALDDTAVLAWYDNDAEVWHGIPALGTTVCVQ